VHKTRLLMRPPKLRVQLLQGILSLAFAMKG
jgi:hypothetical protein